ncbi:MAG: D-glycero-beta-D-manno-heptose-7-phosphate kinase [Candidatus Omnitrophica bacterium]|nr:D-glycero-beta-D-manno-heptose-7-phosphate kinase [Candidatus Omnitrophota bacterium]
MKTQSYTRLKSIISEYKNKRILVIGDLILDEFIWGKVSRISPEAPVPVVWVDSESFMPGGAANVANNISSLGAKVYLVGVVGNDDRAAILRGELEHKGINTDGITTDATRPTILKTRVIAHQQQVVRIDKERIGHIKDSIVNKIVNYVKKSIDEIDAILIEDYGKGLITPKLLKPIVDLAKKYKKTISVDPKEEHFSFYRGVTVITPNCQEASRAVGFKISDKASLKKAGQILLNKFKVKIAIITLGEEGMAVFEEGSPPKRIPTMAQEVYDVSGAGDTVISSFTLSLASGATPIQAAHIANCAAGIVVGKVGISVVNEDELIARIREETLKK